MKNLISFLLVIGLSITHGAVPVWGNETGQRTQDICQVVIQVPASTTSKTIREVWREQQNQALEQYEKDMNSATSPEQRVALYTSYQQQQGHVPDFDSTSIIGKVNICGVLLSLVTGGIPLLLLAFHNLVKQENATLRCIISTLSFGSIGFSAIINDYKNWFDFDGQTNFAGQRRGVLCLIMNEQRKEILARYYEGKVSPAGQAATDHERLLSGVQALLYAPGTPDMPLPIIQQAWRSAPSHIEIEQVGPTVRVAQLVDMLKEMYGPSIDALPKTIYFSADMSGFYTGGTIETNPPGYLIYLGALKNIKGISSSSR